jgi:hypothetical protein
MKCSKFTRNVLVKKTSPGWHPGGRVWALREATACHGHGAEIRPPKSCDAAEWLAIKIILPARSLILSSSFYLGTILIQSRTPANVTPDFQKEKKKKYIFKTRDF